MTKVPAVSVVMSVYNAAPYLEEAVNSILTQTFSDFEFIIVDDGSTDNSLAILEKYANTDSRIRIEVNKKNRRIAYSLNRGIELASAPLIARMDADDVSLPERLEIQVGFMKANPQVAVCGTAVRLYNQSNIWLPPLDTQAIRARLLFESCLYHPTVLMRKETILAFSPCYDTETVPAEDYDLWGRLALSPLVLFANIAKPLLLYRFEEGNSKKAYMSAQQGAADTVRQKLLQGLGISPTQAENGVHKALSGWDTGLSMKELWYCKQWLDTLFTRVCISNYCTGAAIRNELQFRWGRLIRLNWRNPVAFPVFMTSDFKGLELLPERIRKWH